MKVLVDVPAEMYQRVTDGDPLRDAPDHEHEAADLLEAAIHEDCKDLGERRMYMAVRRLSHRIPKLDKQAQKDVEVLMWYLSQ